MSALSPPTAADYAANRGPNLIAGNLVGAILATLAVSMRFGARWVKGRRFTIDDALILFATVLGWGMCVTTIIMVHYGMGRHINTLYPAKADEVLACSKAYYASEIIWTIAILSVKTSILLLYFHMFGKLRYFFYAAWGLGIFTLMWAITTLFVIIFQCHPISYAWNKAENGHCIKSTTYFIIGSSLDVLVDLIIFILPMYAVWNLQLSKIKRVLLLVTFAIGSLSVVFGIIRLAVICEQFRNPDWTWALSYVTLWSTLEPCLGITAICLATTRPLFSFTVEKYKDLSYRWKSSHDSRGSSTVSPSTTHQSSGHNSNRSTMIQAAPGSAPRRPAASLGGSTVASESGDAHEKVSDDETK